MLKGRRASRARTANCSAWSRSSASTSRYPLASRRSIRDWSTSTQMLTPPAIVTASGCAPPIPPSPPVKVIVPASEPPKRFSPTAANVS